MTAYYFIRLVCVGYTNLLDDIFVLHYQMVIKMKENVESDFNQVRFNL